MSKLLWFISALIFESVSCRYDIMHGSNFTLITTKDDPWRYYGSTLLCTNGIDCIVKCSASSVCNSVVVRGPINAKLTLICSSMYYTPPESNSVSGSACSNMLIIANASSQLIINVYDGYAQFESNNIWVPITNKLNTFITCGLIEPTATSAVIKYTSSCAWTNYIYAIHGWKSVQWTYSGYYGAETLTEDHDCHNCGNKMFCGEHAEDTGDKVWNTDCNAFVLDGKYYTCSNKSSICNYDPNDFSNMVSTTLEASTAESTSQQDGIFDKKRMDIDATVVVRPGNAGEQYHCAIALFSCMMMMLWM